MSESQLAVVFLTWNRRDDILESLRLLHQLPTATTTQVIVVDNGSTDGTAAAIALAFPRVRVIALPANEGTSAWNHGITAASASWVLTLDDDSTPATDWLGRVPLLTAQSPMTGIIACRVEAGSERKLVTDGWGRAVTSFIACGAILRREAFQRIGGYDRNIFLYAHEKDLALRMLGSGFDIIYEPSLTVWHRRSSANRSVTRFLRLGIQDSAYRITKLYPLQLVPFGIGVGLLFYAKRCRQLGTRLWRHPSVVLPAITRGIRKGMKARAPMRKEARDRVARIWRSDMSQRAGAWRWALRVLPRSFFF